MNIGYLIREFHFPDDYPACERIWKTVGGGVEFSPSDTFDEIQKKMDYSPDLFLVAEKGEQIIGTVIGGFDGRRGMVYHLAVLPENQGKGIGKALMTEVETRMVAKGCKKMYLLMQSGHPELLNFYGKLGWNQMNVLIAAKEINYR